MRIRKNSRNIGAWLAAIVIVGSVVSGVWPVGAEETTQTPGNMVFFKGGFVGFNSNRGNEFFPPPAGRITAAPAGTPARDWIWCCPKMPGG
jgi:hypothetical protein